jgi:RNA polymerase sigma factor (sigma-70 family)
VLPRWFPAFRVAVAPEARVVICNQRAEAKAESGKPPRSLKLGNTETRKLGVSGPFAGYFEKGCHLFGREWDYVWERNFQVQDLTQLISRAQGGDTDAYDEVVRQFQDRAVAYAYFLLGDFHLAQDAAQEAFCEAFVCLSTLHEPLAFPGWLRRIVFKQCDRIRRKKQVATVGLEAALGEISPHCAPHQAAEKREMALEVRQAIATLTPAQRSVVLLFYLGGHSQNQIAEWLDVPVTTVKRRLYTARHKLKEKMIEMIQEDLQEQRPSKDGEFLRRFHAMMNAVDKGDQSQVQVLLQRDPELLNAIGFYPAASDGEVSALEVAACFNQGDMALFLLNQGADPRLIAQGESALQSAAFHQNHQLANALVERGVSMTIFAAAGLGDAEQVRAFLRQAPGLVHAKDIRGATPLHQAGSAAVAQVLLEAGADIEALDDEYHNTPVEYACSHADVVQFLLEQGAKLRFPLACAIGAVEAARQMLQAQPDLHGIANGPSRPEANTLPLGIATIYGQPEIVTLLLDSGADVNAVSQSDGNATALHFAARGGHLGIVKLLLQRGANVSATTTAGETPHDWALRGQKEGWSTWNANNPHPPLHQAIIDLLHLMANASPGK